jgi:hypothetical protein
VIVDEDVEPSISRLRSVLEDAGIRVLSAEERPYSLEDVFIVTVERSRQQEAGTSP